MIDRRPAAIVRAAGAADVIRAVGHARESGGLLSIKGGGHNVAGNAVSEGGLMIDLSAMRSVRIDPIARTARVEPGATLGDLDREAQAFGLATPLGINSTTGVAGLTLGGGFGWLSRMHGLASDNLISVDVVTASGKLLRASGKENEDLFWAIRGGGGNFGVVTSFEFRLHPVGPEVFAGVLVHPLANAKAILQGYRHFATRAPDDIACWALFRKAPPLPFLPPEAHGQTSLILAVCHAGDPARGPDAIAPLRALGTPVGEHVGPVPYAAWQANFDPMLGPGMRNYWKSHAFRELSDKAIDTVVRHAGRLPTGDSDMAFAHLGGAVSRVAADATAYPHRDALFTMTAHARWSEPAEDKGCAAWARGVFEEMAPFATGGVYVNFMSDDETKRVAQGAYGRNHERLARIKRKYDPENLFRMNHNIRPAP